jgi:hypothetical protein
MKTLLRRLQFALFTFPIICVVLLSGCGGGSGGSAAALTPAVSTMIAGTAAAGAPVIGFVSVRDSSTSAQPVKTNIPIQANGHYAVDVAGLKAPFAFLASGTVGGKSVSLYSVATTADVGGTINITPFTDLIIRNVAATAIDTYINSGAYASLTAAQLDVKRVALTVQLAPALTAMGVSGSIDLLRATFNADSTGLDRFMDVVKVSTTPTSATITNILDAANTLLINTAAGGTTATANATLTAANLTTTATTPVDQILAGMNAFSAMFATSLPSSTAPALVAMFSTSFLDNGQNAAAFLTQITTQKNIVGLKFSNVAVSSVNAASGIAQVSFIPMSASGVNLSNNNKAERWQMIRNASGVWQMAGNRMIASVSVRTNASKNTCNPLNTTCFVNPNPNYQTGLNLQIDNMGAQAIGSAIVTGPGLPAGGVNMVQQVNQTWFAITTVNASNPGCLNCGTNTWNMTDAEIALVLPNSTYTVAIYSNANPPVLVETDTFVITAAPLLNTQLPTLAFPSLTGIANFAGTGAVTLTPTWLIPAGLKGDWIDVQVYQNVTNATQKVGVDLTLTPTATGTATIVFTAPASGVWSSGNYWINARDANGGGINTSYQ